MPDPVTRNSEVDSLPSDKANIIDLSEQDDTPPESLFHYTTAEGLIGIVSHRKLWATYAGCLRDPEGFTYVREVIGNALEAKLAGIVPPILRHYLETVMEIYPDCIAPPHYVVCFSENPSLPSEWRRLAQEGGGYAVEMISKRLPRRLGWGNYTSLRRVIYDADVQKRVVREAIDKAVREVELFTPQEAYIEFLACKLALFYLTFKSPRNIAERVAANQPCTDRRVSGG